MYKAIFFDLDGTLLGMDDEAFLKLYFINMVQYCNKNGLDGRLIAEGIEYGTMAMINNCGTDTNETIFWKSFEKYTRLKRKKLENILNQFYITDFNKVQPSCFLKKDAIEIIRVLKDKGYPLYLTTNAIFPRVAVLQRLKWAGLKENNFEYITTYENTYFCKPNPKYYQSVIKQFDLNSNEILMIGNDVLEDGIIQTLNVDFYLLKDSILNRKNLDIIAKYSTDIQGLLEFVKQLPTL